MGQTTNLNWFSRRISEPSTVAWGPGNHEPQTFMSHVVNWELFRIPNPGNSLGDFENAMLEKINTQITQKKKQKSKLNFNFEKRWGKSEPTNNFDHFWSFIVLLLPS